MFIIDEWAERHIVEAQLKGDFDNLSGCGRPLQLDDNSAVPEELRSAFHLLKNAGYLPQELLDRKEALTLIQLLQEINPEHPEHDKLNKQIRLLELRLQQAGMSTDFLRTRYQSAISDKSLSSSQKS
ncbi:DUF1992 domain-containing protein [Pectobacteriaceae bacterium C52]|nr:DUF1992 domain-containing protein [Pectobacteriaceae bacterium C52]